MDSDILFETRGAVLVVTFNRPKEGNVLTVAMAKTLNERLKSIADNRAIRAVLLRGQGDLFMNGHDLRVYNGDALSIQDFNFQKIQFFYGVVRELQAMERPVIAAVDGRVTGVGFSLMLASDFVIASKRTVFNADFMPYALIPDSGTTFFLARKVGAGRASEILMLNEDFTAEEAKNLGLVTKVSADGALATDALAFAEKLANGPTRAYAATKRLIGKAFEEDLNAHLAVESANWNTAIKTFDFREAIKAFFAKREPKFSGS